MVPWYQIPRPRETFASRVRRVQGADRPIMDCPAGFTAAPPNASFTYNCYGLTRETYPSLHDCVDRCAADGAVPACVTSLEELAFLFSGVVQIDGGDRLPISGDPLPTSNLSASMAWLGVYKDPATSCGTSGPRASGASSSAEAQNCARSGWDFCVDGSAANISLMWSTTLDGYSRLNENPGNEYGFEYCSLLTTITTTRIVRECGAMVESYACLCGGPAEASARFAADLVSSTRRR